MLGGNNLHVHPVIEVRSARRTSDERGEMTELKHASQSSDESAETTTRDVL